MIGQAFDRLRRSASLVAYPVVLDLLALMLGLAFGGFHGQSRFTLKLSLGVGLPSVSGLLDQNVMANGVNISLGGPGVPGLLLLLTVAFLLLTAYVQGGFIGLLHQAAKDRPVSFGLFQQYAGAFWLRFLGILLLVGLFTLAAGGLSLILGPAGILLFLMVYLTLRVLYVYWEFTVVVENCGIGEAWGRAREFFRNRTADTTAVILAILASNFAFALVLNGLWSPPVLVLGIFAYGYVATGLQLALMLTLHDIRGPEAMEDAVAAESGGLT